MSRDCLYSIAVFTSYLFLAFLAPFIFCKEINITVDDQNGDSLTGALPTYLPINKWNNGQNCPNCSVKPDTSRAFDGTWRDTTTFTKGDVPHNISYTFNGTAIYAFFIFANQQQGNFSKFFFTLDDRPSIRFIHESDSSKIFEYNVPAFNMTGLNHTQHTLLIENDIGRYNSNMLFDYLIYTTDDGANDDDDGKSSASTSETALGGSNTVLSRTSNPTQTQYLLQNTSTGLSNGTVIGGTVAGTLSGLVCGLIGAVLYYRRKRKGCSLRGVCEYTHDHICSGCELGGIEIERQPPSPPMMNLGKSRRTSLLSAGSLASCSSRTLEGAYDDNSEIMEGATYTVENSDTHVTDNFSPGTRWWGRIKNQKAFGKNLGSPSLPSYRS